MAVRKKLQRVGKSRCVILDLDLLEALLPDGDLEQTLLVEVVGDALVIRRETSTPLSVEAVAAAVAPNSPRRDLNPLEQRVLQAVSQGPGNSSEVTERIGNRSRPTVSLALNRLLRAGLVEKTGRDWRLSAAGKATLESIDSQP